MRHLAIALVVAFASFTTGAGADSEVPAGAVLAELPFLAIDEPNRVYLDLGREGGEPFRVMLATGASFSEFTPLAARAAGIPVRSLKSTTYRHATRLGRDVQFYVDTESSDTGSKTGWEYGQLGANFLEEYVVEIDFAERRVRFLDPKQYAVPEAPLDATEAIVPIELTSGRPVLEIRVDGRPIEVMIDTGCSLSAVLSGSAAKAVGIDTAALADFGELHTAVGRTSARFYEAREVEIGGTRFASVPVVVAPNGWFNQGTTTNSALCYDLISRFRVRIDYPRKRISLKQQSEQVTYQGVDYASTRETGAFLWAVKPGYYVSRVIPDTAASRLGIQAGDTLLRESAGDAQRRTLEEILAAIRDGKPVRVARQMNDVWIDIDLPDDPALNSEAASGDGDD